MVRISVSKTEDIGSIPVAPANKPFRGYDRELLSVEARPSA